MKLQKGFTLIELMIVIAIIAILAAIAIPAYQDFLIRSRVTDMNTQAGACKSSVAEFYASRGTMPLNVTEAGCTLVGTENSAAPAVTNGTILVPASATFAPVLAAKLSGINLGLRPACGTSAAGAAGSTTALCGIGGLSGPDIQQWLCTPLVGSTDITPKYLPAQCR